MCFISFALFAAHCQDIKLSCIMRCRLSCEVLLLLFFLTLLPVLLNKRLQQNCVNCVLNVVILSYS